MALVPVEEDSSPRKGRPRGDWQQIAEVQLPLLLPSTTLYCLLLLFAAFTAFYWLLLPLLPFTAFYCPLLPFSVLYCLLLPRANFFTAFNCPLLPSL